MPKVSIIIPTYNYAHLIGQTLTCLIDQKFTDWEAIIVDDGSEDQTEKIVEEYVKKDLRFTFFRQQNKGVSAARNNAIRLSRGKYIQFLDADDLISPKKISLQYEELENNNADISLAKTKYFESENPKVLFADLDKSEIERSEKLNGSGYEIIVSYIKNNQTAIQSPLFKKEIVIEIGFFREDMHYLEDWDFWLRCAFFGYKFSFLDSEDAFGLVRIHAQSASKQSTKIIEAEGKLRDLINQYIKNSLLSNQIQIELIKLNNKLLVNTFKYLMAKTPYTNIQKFKNYHSAIKNKLHFYSALFKSLNLKRKNS